MTMYVRAEISAPASMAHQFCKRNMRHKDVHFRAVMWSGADYICDNEACRFAQLGYRDYVQDLEERVKVLEERLRKIT